MSVYVYITAQHAALVTSEVELRFSWPAEFLPLKAQVSDSHIHTKLTSIDQ